MNTDSSPNKSILIIENDVINSAFLNLSISKLLKNDYTIYIAESATKALDLISNTNPKLIILNHYLPDMKGTELAKKIKLQYSYNIKIIMLTSLDPSDIQTKLINYIDDFIIIPATIDSIYHVLKRTLPIKENTSDSFFNDKINQPKLHFNKEVFYEKIGNEQDFIKFIFKAFFRNFMTSLNKIKESLNCKDRDLYFKNIHYLKGETSTLCLEIINQDINELEKIAFESTEEIQSILLKIKNEFLWLQKNNIPF